MEAVTVVIPTRNRPELLRLTLWCVLRQRDAAVRAVVVDDGSTVDTEAAVSAFADDRVRVIRHAVPQGVSAARNRGISEATTEWVAFCDDDDLWSPDKLVRQVESARAIQRDWVYAGCVMVNRALEIRGGSSPPGPEGMVAALRRCNAVPAGASNVLVRTDLLRRVGGFDERLTHVPDWDLWLRLAAHGLPAWVPQPLVAYRMHAGNASLRTAEMLAELGVLERRYGLSKTRSPFHRHLAQLCLRSGRHVEALNHFFQALLRIRDGYSLDELRWDARLVRVHAAEILRRRLRRPISARARARMQAASERDPNAGWKAEARLWLRDVGQRGPA
jgi:glycosyltransferase involved in cell wall biosynthesis